MTDRPTDAENTESLSAIKVFSLFQKAISKINTFPLTKKNITIQQDAYKRLAVVDETEPATSYEVFATLACLRKEKDSDLRFGVDFAAAGATLFVESIGPFFLSFDKAEVKDPFKDEQDAVSHIVDTLVMLANGQISCLVTLRNDRWCAVELLIHEPHSRIPTVIGTEGNYPKRWKSSDREGYETLQQRNDYLDEQIPLPKELLLARRGPDGELALKGRVFTSAVLEPLTKDVYEHLITELNMREAGKKADESAWNMLYRAWETWIFLAGMVALAWLGIGKGYVPHFVVSAPVVLLPVVLVLVGLILIPLLKKKEQLRVSKPGHIWFAVDRAISAVGRMAAHLTMPAVTILLIVSTWWPIYFLPHTRQPVNLYQLALPAIITCLAPVLFGVAVLASVFRNKKGAIVGTLSIWAGVILILVINGVATNVAEGTPEPYTSITTVALFFAPILSAAILWQSIKRAKLERQQAGSVDAAEKVQQKLRTLQYAGLVICYTASVLLGISAFLFKESLAPEAIAYGRPIVLWLGILGCALVLAIVTLGFNVKRLRPKEFYWTVIVLLIGLLFGFSISLKNGVEEGQGSGLAWLLFSVAVLGPISVLLTGQAVANRLQQRALNARTFGKTPKRPTTRHTK